MDSIEVFREESVEDGFEEEYTEPPSESEVDLPYCPRPESVDDPNATDDLRGCSILDPLLFRTRRFLLGDERLEKVGKIGPMSVSRLPRTISAYFSDLDENPAGMFDLTCAC